MFSEVVKLVPQMDRSALNRMFQSLNSRFTSVAKKFGQGMKNALKFGGIIGLVGGLVSRLLNPLEKAEAVIDRILKKGDDAQTNAEEFQSDPGKLLRLEALAQAHGLEADTLRQFLSKFQAELAKETEAAQAPARIQQQLGKETDPVKREVLQKQLTDAQDVAAQGGRLKEFIGEKDIASAFFNFIQSMQKLPKTEQTVVQSEIFGERIRGKAAEFFNASPEDFAATLKRLPSADTLAAAAKRTGDLSDKRDADTAVRELDDFVNKSKLVNPGQISALDQSARLDMQSENETLKRFDALKTSSIAIQELTHKFDVFTTQMLNTVLPELLKGVNTISKVADEFLPSFNDVKDTVTNGFDNTVQALSDVTDAVGTIWDKGGEVIDGVAAKAGAAISTIEGIWGEFKSSRIYKTFGGK